MAAIIPVTPELVSQFSALTASADESPSVRAMLVRAVPAGAMKPTLELVREYSSAGEKDSEEFSKCLKELLLGADDVNTSGYVLYRLDSRAAAGSWEWICCAYQPDGAKIKEKMLYTQTRSSLLAALNERNFLETVFGGSLKDFSFPARLRNSRKHDYQNPQQSTKGRPASEAAGTGTGGARRNFGVVSAVAAAAPAAKSPSPASPASPASPKPAAASPQKAPSPAGGMPFGAPAGAAFGAPAPRFTAAGLKQAAAGDEQEEKPAVGADETEADAKEEAEPKKDIATSEAPAISEPPAVAADAEEPSPAPAAAAAPAGPKEDVEEVPAVKEAENPESAAEEDKAAPVTETAAPAAVTTTAAAAASDSAYTSAFQAAFQNPGAAGTSAVTTPGTSVEDRELLTAISDAANRPGSLDAIASLAQESAAARRAADKSPGADAEGKEASAAGGPAFWSGAAPAATGDASVAPSAEQSSAGASSAAAPEAETVLKMPTLSRGISSLSTHGPELLGRRASEHIASVAVAASTAAAAAMGTAGVAEHDAQAQPEDKAEEEEHSKARSPEIESPPAPVPAPQSAAIERSASSANANVNASAAAAAAEPSLSAGAGGKIAKGVGQGKVADLLTDQERDLQRIKDAQRADSLGSRSTISLGVGCTIDEDVEPAIRGLASHLSGTSEWNTVVLSIDTKAEVLQLDQPTRFVPAAELCSLLSSNEPRLLFYRYDYDAKPRRPSSADSSGGAPAAAEPATVLYVYCCPGQSPIRHKMLYSCNVLPLLHAVRQIEGINVGKKIEISDPAELTSAMLAEEVESMRKPLGNVEQALAEDLNGAAPAGAAAEGTVKEDADTLKTFSRPKKPGRR